MPKFDAEKHRFSSAVRSSRWTPGGKGAARFRLILFDHAMTPAGVGGFWDPWKIGNRFKNAFLRIDWHFDPRKIASGRGYGKKHENSPTHRRVLNLIGGKVYLPPHPPSALDPPPAISDIV